MPNSQKEQTDFGFETVSPEEKTNRVGEVFQSVAEHYDRMNDAMSFGLHRLWKRYTVQKAALRPGDQVLDLAAGSGDLSLKYAKKVGKTGKVWLSDINPAMLAQAKKRVIDANCFSTIELMEINAENIPFDDNCFHFVSIGFGLRNVTDKARALREMYRVLKPGGKAFILEFSTPTSSLLGKAYDAFSFNVIPKLGKWIAQDEDSYRYLVESIRMHPNQQQLTSLMETAGFESVSHVNLTGGIVALHMGYKY